MQETEKIAEQIGLEVRSQVDTLLAQMPKRRRAISADIPKGYTIGFGKFKYTYVPKARDVLTAEERAKASPRLTRLRANPFLVARFTRQLSVMLDAGVPLIRAMTNLAYQPESPVFGLLIETVAKEIEGGKAISKVIAKYPRTFGLLYTSMTRVGETNGKLPEALAGVADLMEREQEMIAKLKSALTYPFVILGVGGIIGWLMFAFLLPQFAIMFEQMHLELPMITRVVMLFVHLAINPLTVLGVPMIIAGLYQGYNHVISTEEGRHTMDNITLQLPVFGNILRKTAIARMARSLATLFSSGVPVATTLKLAGDTCGNEVYRRHLHNAVASVEQGEQLCKSFSPDTSDFHPLVYYMVAIGEETGRLDDLMDKLANYFEEEVNVLLESMASLLEPIFTAGIGILIGTICLAIFLPLYGLINQLGG